MSIFKNWWFKFWGTLLFIFAMQMGYGGLFTQLPLSSAPADSKRERVEAFIAGAWGGQAKATDPDPLLRERGVCWVTSFKGGYPVAQEFSQWEPRNSALPRLLADPRLREMEAVEVGVATNLTVYNHEVIPRQEVGLWGLLFRCSSGDLFLTPAEFPRRSELPDGQALKYRAERAVLRQAKFQAQTWVLRHDSDFRPAYMVRGDTIVAPDTMKNEAIEGAAREVGGYLQRLVKRQNGLLPYSYVIATGLTSDDERNLVKVCLGSLSLARYARFSGQEPDREVSQQHLKTMMARFGHRYGDKAAITESEVSWLGTQALFAQALRLQPGPADATFKDFEEGLAHTMVACLQPDGHFQSSLPLPGSSPQEEVDLEKDENQNPFPGMALTYLAERIHDGSQVISLETLDRSLKYYTDRFRRRPDKAAIPWLVEAYYQRFAIDQDRQAADNLFFLVDWNLSNLQEWNLMEPQLRGALINPDRLQYGPTCFTSDVGCQVQGLTWGYRAACLLKDGERAGRYAAAIGEMSRYLRQMQIRQKGDLYWLSTGLRETPQGGLRDNASTYSMQIDSSASALSAWAEWLGACKESSRP